MSLLLQLQSLPLHTLRNFEKFEGYLAKILVNVDFLEQRLDFICIVTIPHLQIHWKSSVSKRKHMSVFTMFKRLSDVLFPSSK